MKQTWSFSKMTRFLLVLWLIFQLLNFPVVNAGYGGRGPAVSPSRESASSVSDHLSRPVTSSTVSVPPATSFTPGVIGQELTLDNQNLAAQTVPSAPSAHLNLMLELQNEPAVVRHLALQNGRNIPQSQLHSETKAYIGQLESNQQSVLLALSKLKVSILYQMQRVYNGIAISLDDPSELPQLYQLPGVKAVHEIIPKKLADISSAEAIGATRLWQTNGLNLSGEGVKIAVIDSGIDFKHADFGGSPTSTFPTGKVAGGYDFVGNNYDGTNTPQPGPVPQDCAASGGQGGHGTHVAGIAAGYGVKSDGSAYNGSYDSASLAAASLVISPGIAPRATLYAYKVFGCKSLNSDSLVVDQAIERAVDPNQDGDFSDRADIINLSLGGAFGSNYDTTAIAANNAALLGVIVVAAAGNNGDVYYSTASPAAADRVVSVASSVDSASVLNGFKVNSPPELAQPQPYPATEAIFGPDLVASGPLTASVQLPISTTNQTGCNPFSASEPLAGHVVVLVRGGCSFKLKAKNSQNAGGVGVLIYNNQAGDPVEMGDDPVVSDTITIPVFMASQNTGQALVNALQAAKTVSVTFNAAYRNTVVSQDDTRLDTLSVFSSRGPRRGDSFLKPDLAAPGESIFSARSGSGSGGLSESGTSMASPQVAGAFALLLQQHKNDGWSAEEFKALAMNTATPQLRTAPPPNSTRYGPGRVGAGRIDLVAASKAPVVAYNAASPGLVSLSYGNLEVESGAGPVQYSQVVKIINKSLAPVSYNLSYQGVINAPGAAFVPAQSVINLAGGASQNVNVALTIDPAQLLAGHDPSNTGDNSFLPEAGGYLVLTPGGPNAGPVLRVPVYAAPRLISKMTTSQTSLNFGTAATANTTLTLKGQGLNTGSNYPTATVSLVSALELQHQSPALSQGHGGYKSADLKYVGVTSDYFKASNNLTNTTLYFGLATYGRWSSPNPADTQFRIYLDTNNDGRDDFVLYNTTLSQANGEQADSDRFVGFVQSLSTGASAVTGPLNGLDPALRDSSLFNTSVMLLPLPTSLLGLTPGNTRITYRVLSYQHDTAGPVDTTPSLSYDVANAGLDLSGQGTGEGGNPVMYRDLPGQAVSVKYKLAGFSANNSQGVLLLHHHNGADNQAQAVVVGNVAPGYGSNPLPGETLEVGRAEVTKVTTSTLLIKGTGQRDLVVSNPQLSGPQAGEFSILAPAFPFTITSGTTLTRQIVVQCQPGALDTRAASLTLTTNDPGHPTVSYPLSCAGRPPVFISTGDGSWVWQNPQPQSGVNYSASCPSAQVCYIASSIGGVIMATADGGDSWYSIDTGITSSSSTPPFPLVSCPNIQTCYIYVSGYTYGVGKVFASYDAGSTWVARSVALPINAGAFGCPTTLVCNIITNDLSPLLYTSQDGGVSWITHTLPAPNPPNDTVTSLSCRTANLCYLSFDSGISYKTTDGGASWLSISGISTSSYNCLDDNDCIFLGSKAGQSGLLVSTDGGVSWVVRSLPPTQGSSSLVCATLTNCRLIQTLNFVQTLYLTNDGGQSWQPDSAPEDIENLQCPSAQVCYSFNNLTNAILSAKSNSPNKWKQISTGVRTVLRDISCPVDNTCYTVGDGQLILGTNNGGAQWVQRYQGNPQANFRAISCPDQTNCYVAGTGGAILVTKNGGASWSFQVSGVISDLQKIACPSTQVCYAATTSGEVLVTTNGGTNWQAYSVGPHIEIEGLSCPAQNICYVINQSSQVFLTTNGGSSWQAKTNYPGVTVFAIDCPTTLICYVGGRPTPSGPLSSIGVTTDGAATWNTTQLFQLYPQSIKCLSQTVCRAAGGGGTVYTQDGGQNWVYQSAAASLYGIACRSFTQCYAAGVNGAILSNATPWQPRISGTGNGLNRMACPTVQVCIAVGVSGTIQLSSNGGQSWQAGNSPISNTNITLNDISCSASLCAAVGQQGTILVSGDLGNSWVIQSTAVTVTLYGVSCYSTACVAVGEQGFILGGSGFILGGSGFILGGSWTVQPSGTSVTLYGVSCTLNFCFAVGEQGFILGGSGFILGGSGFILGGSWTVQPSGTKLTLYGIYCNDQGCIAVGEQGFILGGSGFILGGSGFILGGSWLPYATTTLNTLRSVSCQPQTGGCYAVGANGIILSGSSRPGSWTPEESSTLRDLKGIACSQNCLSAGSSGTIVARAALGGPNLSPGYDSQPLPGNVLDFGQVKVGQVTTATLTVKSRGSLAIQIYTPTITGLNPAEFGLAVPAAQAFPISFNGSLDFRLRCQPTQSGDRFATLNVPTNDPNQPLVSYRLKCTGTSFIFVTNAADSGTGSLRSALALAQTGDTISFTLGTPVTIPVNSTLPPVRAGVKLEGQCTLASGPTITLSWKAAPVSTLGLILEGNNSLSGLRLVGIKGTGLRTGGAGNKLACIAIGP